jgi:hypothetical protein
MGMAESAGDLTFTFDADFSGLTRAAAGAGQVLDRLGQQASKWSEGTAASVSKPFDAALGGPLRLSGSMAQAAQALRNPAVPPSPSVAADDAAAAKVLGHLSDQLALLKTTGSAHDAIVERMKIEAEQAKLGLDATDGQKQAVASLVTQIEAARAAQVGLRAEQNATNSAWRAGSNAVAQGFEAMILDGARLQDVARSLLSTFARQGLSAALTGRGPFAGLFGTAGANGAVGGLFGAVQGLFGPSLKDSALSGSNFAGLYAEGGSIAAGQWGVVGEKGAEVVAGPASVVPVGKLPSAPQPATHQTINFNVTTPDAPSFARSEGQMAAVLGRIVARGQRNS